jgi:vanillate O-demethylase monooxygenase subunit
MGDEEKADEKLVPDLSFIDRTPPQGRIPGYMPTKANYQLVTDNILDLSHADYLHPDTLGGMMTNADFQCEPDGDEVLLSWEARNVLAPGVFKAEIAPPQHGDFLIDVRWQAPAVMVLKIAGKPHGEPIEDDDFSLTLHNMVPENEKSTHYFYCATRTTMIDDPTFMAMLKAGLEHSFLNEDKPMLEKQQQRIGDADFWSLRPRTLSIDKGAVWVRRKLESLISAENA